jgi:iron(III) transport system permease protein
VSAEVVTNSSRSGRLAQIGLPLAGVLAGVLLVAGPFVATVLRSVLHWDDAGAVSLSLRNFAVLFQDPRFYDAALNTLICGAGAMVVSCVLGLSLAWVVARTDMPGRSWFEVLNLIPFFLSPYVGAVSWIYLAAPNSGLIQATFASVGIPLDFLNIYSIGGVIWVLSLFYTPYVYLFVIAPMRQMDASLEDAARVHGASFFYTARRITIPLLMPALLSGALVVFVTSAGLFDVPLALASPKGIRMMPTEIFGLVQYPSDFGKAAAFGMVVLVVTILLALWQRHYLGQRRYDTVSGKGYRPRTIHLRPLARAGALTLEIVFIGASVVLPIIALLMVSFSSIWTGRLNPAYLTLDNYQYVLFGYDLARDAIVNSLFLALVGATIGVVISVLQAYYLHRSTSRGKGFVEAILSLPLGIPGIILGLGFLILAIRTPLYSTLTIILIAYIARFFPFSLRTISAMFVSINPELEQSARASGASWLQTMRLVLLPLLKPALISAWLMLFVIFIRELGATVLLYAQGTETISVALVILSERSFGHVAALAVIQLLLLLTAFVMFKVTRTSVVQN